MPRPRTAGARRTCPARSQAACRWREQHLDAGVVGGQEAVELVLEVLVERLARDARAADDVGHRRGRVALLGDRGRDRVDQPPPLGGQDHLALDPMAPRGSTRGGSIRIRPSPRPACFRTGAAGASHFSAAACANDDNVVPALDSPCGAMEARRRRAVQRRRLAVAGAAGLAFVRRRDGDGGDDPPRAQRVAAHRAPTRESGGRRTRVRGRRDRRSPPMWGAAASRCRSRARSGRLIVAALPRHARARLRPPRAAAGRASGAILFHDNVASPGQLRALTRTLRRAGGPGTLVAVDQEGGPIRIVNWAPPVDAAPAQGAAAGAEAHAGCHRAARARDQRQPRPGRRRPVGAGLGHRPVVRSAPRHPPPRAPSRPPYAAGAPGASPRRSSTSPASAARA